MWRLWQQRRARRRRVARAAPAAPGRIRARAPRRRAIRAEYARRPRPASALAAAPITSPRTGRNATYRADAQQLYAPHHGPAHAGMPIGQGDAGWRAATSAAPQARHHISHGQSWMHPRQPVAPQLHDDPAGRACDRQMPSGKIGQRRRKCVVAGEWFAHRPTLRPRRRGNNVATRVSDSCRNHPPRSRFNPPPTAVGLCARSNQL